MRTLVPIVAILTLNLSAASVCASSGDNKPPDPDAIAALEARANQAQPREQTFLYAELVQQMTELSIRQYAAGDAEKATNLLKRIQQIAEKIHLSLTDNDKRLKNAEMLLSHTAFRLNEMLHASSVEDRPLVEQTLAQVTEAQNATLMQVFRK
jgi:flagellin-specific chaperone FliS